MIHVLRTRSPVYSPLRAFSLDLHVLNTQPAFVLSQDQTLHLSIGVSFLAHLHPTSAKRGREVHSKHCEFRNPSSWTCYPVFRDRPDTSFPLHTSDDSASRRVQHPGEGRASYRCQLLRVKDLASVPARTPRLQGSRGVADRSRAVNFPGQFASNLAWTSDSSAVGRIRRRCRFLQALPDQVDLLAAARDRGLGLHHLDLTERLLERPEEIIEPASHEDLDHEAAGRLEDLPGQLDGPLRERERSRLVGAAHAGGLRRQVAEDRVVRSTALRAQPLEELGRKSVRDPRAHRRRQAGDGFQVDAQHEPAQPHLARGDLAPPAGCSAQVEHPCARAQDAQAALDLLELVGGAGAQPFLLRSLEEPVARVVAGHAPSLRRARRKSEAPAPGGAGAHELPIAGCDLTSEPRCCCYRSSWRYRPSWPSSSSCASSRPSSCPTWSRSWPRCPCRSSCCPARTLRTKRNRRRRGRRRSCGSF